VMCTALIICDQSTATVSSNRPCRSALISQALAELSALSFADFLAQCLLSSKRGLSVLWLKEHSHDVYCAESIYPIASPKRSIAHSRTLQAWMEDLLAYGSKVSCR
jgi:hypothetical protein